MLIDGGAYTKRKRGFQQASISPMTSNPIGCSGSNQVFKSHVYLGSLLIMRRLNLFEQ